MSFKLTFNPAANPFPYAPLVLASYVNRPNIEVVFDSGVVKATLDYEGEQVTAVNHITGILAKSANIASDDAKVCVFMEVWFGSDSCPDSCFPCSGGQTADDHHLP